MDHVLPSDVVQVIDEEFPITLGLTPPSSSSQVATEGYRAASMLQGILELIRRVPEEFVTIDSKDRARLILASISLEQAAEFAHQNRHPVAWPRLKDNTPCLDVVREVLKKCSDEAPSQSTTGLEFIEDHEFRKALLIDLGSTERAVSGNEWKAATVLAGSIIEALLLWAIQQHKLVDRSEAMKRAVKSKRLTKALQVNDLTAWEWSLHPYIEVAYELGEIKEHTANPCREAKYYRNLIHPAAAEREKEQCTRGKAHGALGAVYSTIEDLEERHLS